MARSAHTMQWCLAWLSLSVVLMGGCSFLTGLTPSATVPSGFELEVQNIDGPRVIVMINGTSLGAVGCGATETFAPGIRAPALPWSLSLVRDDGPVLKEFIVTGTNGSRVLIRGNSARLGGPGSAGPMPRVTCPPA